MSSRICCGPHASEEGDSSKKILNSKKATRMSLRRIIDLIVSSYRSGTLSRPRVRAVLLFSVGIYLILMLGLGYAWYSAQWASNGFHFFNDWPEWKQLDKFAHFFWTFQVSALATRLLVWAQSDGRKAAMGGAALGFMFVSCVEIPDGFSEDYGASLFDILANALGCSAFIAQSLLWKRIMVWPKFSFHQTMFAPLRPNVLGDGIMEEILKDYNGQTFWYSLQIPKLPFPHWITLAVGVGAEGMIHGRDAENAAANFSPTRKYFLSFDLNLTGIKTESRLLNSVLYVFNIIKSKRPIKHETHREVGLMQIFVVVAG